MQLEKSVEERFLKNERVGSYTLYNKLVSQLFDLFPRSIENRVSECSLYFNLCSLTL